MNEIPKYSLIYYISGHRFQLGFSASSEPMFEIVRVKDVSRFFEDTRFTSKIALKVLGQKNKDLFQLILTINEILGEDCMAFNHNA